VYGGNTGDHFLHRIAVISLAFAPLMILLSISYESLFYFCFCSTVSLWLLVEKRVYEVQRQSKKDSAKAVPTTRSLQMRDVRTTLMFMFFVNVAFFGTGNVASLGSFSLESVYRFVTIFNPFLMGMLLIIKILIPFFIISTVYGMLAQILDLPAFSLFLLVVSITDIQTINFFYFVTDYGSWLEIGTSISHFCIAELFIVFTICLFWLGQVLIGKVDAKLTVDQHNKKQQ
jgi:GPI ethanolamine phosphate transferase 1